jgi:polysaccharide chain length determinant protein (PEP-CTERM system associated)
VNPGSSSQAVTFNLQEVLDILLRRIWYLVIPFVLSVVTAVILCYALPKSYRSTTLILVEQQKVPQDYVKSSVASSIEERLTTLRQQVMSRSLLQKVIEEFGLYKKLSETKPQDELVELLRKKIEVNVERTRREVDAFSVSYEGEDPYTVMQVTNRLTSLFIEQNLKAREEFVTGTTLFLDSELENVKADLERQEAALQEFRRRYMGELPEQLQANLQTLGRFHTDLQATTEALAKALEQQGQVGAAPPGVASSGQPAVVVPDAVRLKQLEIELTDLRSRYTERHPDVLRVRTEIEEIRRRLAPVQAEKKQEPAEGTALSPQTRYEALDAEIVRLKTRQKSLEQQIKQYQARVENTPLREQQMLGLQRDYDNTKRHYQSLLDKKLNAQIAENLEKRQKGEQFRILDPANLPTRPYKPNQLVILLMGMLIGLGSGGGLAYLREMVDTSFMKVQELEATLDLPVLASIPNIPWALKREAKRT